MIYVCQQEVNTRKVVNKMEKDFFNDIVVVKRSGQRVNFNPTKVAIAIKKDLIVYMKTMMKNQLIMLKKKYQIIQKKIIRNVRQLVLKMFKILLKRL